MKNYSFALVCYLACFAFMFSSCQKENIDSPKENIPVYQGELAENQDTIEYRSGPEPDCEYIKCSEIGTEFLPPYQAYANEHCVSFSVGVICCDEDNTASFWDLIITPNSANCDEPTLNASKENL